MRIGGVAVGSVAILVMLLALTPAPVIRECPHDIFDADSLLPGDTLSVPGRITNVPEYHDCQRFLLDQNKTLVYGELEAVYVRYNLYRILQEEERHPARAVADRWSIDSASFPGATRETLIHTIVVGEVRSEGSYLPLGIVKGYNCIVLRWISVTQPTSFVGWMVPVTKEETCSPENVGALAGLPRTRLHVTRHAPLSVPSTTQLSRWEWDPHRSLQFIGITCPGGWCDLRGYAGTPDPNPLDDDGLSIAEGANKKITEGTWDWQYLAKYTSSPFGVKLSRDGAYGMIVPDEALASYTITDYQAHNWLTVAWVGMNDTSKNYHDMLNFEKAWHVSPHGPLNKVEMCFSKDGSDCTGGRPPDACAKDTNLNGYWYARVTSAEGGLPMYKCVTQTITYVTVGTVKVVVDPPPGVVRWRWLAVDETMWISCPSGCCEVKVRGGM
jgi:hypothetical protein